MKLSTSKDSMGVPVGGIIPWQEHNRIIHSGTYGYRIGNCTGAYQVGFSFTGQDLINAGYAEGEVFRWQSEARRVIVDQSILNAGIRIYADPSTTTPNATVSGTILSDYQFSNSTWFYTPIQTITTFAWTAATEFVVAWNQYDYNSSREHYTQFKDFAFLKEDNILPNTMVKCEGQILDDIESPLHGLTIPDLNGENRFLRGHDTLNTEAGGTHRHTITSTTTLSDSGSGGSTDSHGHLLQSVTYYSNSTNSEPPYYNAIFIMRVK